MTRVKTAVPDDALHTAALMGLLFKEIHETFDAEDWHGLRQSHMRVVSMVPAEGINVTELATRLRMTKQGCGQFVRGLSESGFLETVSDPGDGRLRIVRRTPAGDRLVAQVTTRMEAIERTWAGQVGHRRYATFRRVLREIALRSE